MVGNGSCGDGGGNEPFTGRAAIGCDHGHDAQFFYSEFGLDLNHVEGFVEGCLETIGEEVLRGEWGEGDRR
jgi:hypothetical protein